MNRPLSDAVVAGDLIFLSGTPPLENDEVHAPEDVKAQTLFIMERIRTILKRYHLALENLAYVQVFLRSLDDYQAMNEAYESCFSAPYPARKVVVSQPPREHVRIEISGIASIHPRQV